MIHLIIPLKPQSITNPLTRPGQCLNANSQCTEKYKNSVISNYLHRAYKISQNWSDFHAEILHIKQLLVNNNYSNSLIDKQIESFLNNKFSPGHNNDTNKTKIPLYYQSQFHSNYKVEERIVKTIINSNVKCTDPNTTLNLIFYYKNKKSSNLIMKNNTAPPPSTPQKTNVVYKFSCPFPHREAEDYIGLTSTTLERRLARHIHSGSIKSHLEDSHNVKPTKSQLLDNTSILTFANTRQKLFIKEALLISQQAPKINRQYDNFTNVLKLYKPRHNNDSNYNSAPPSTNPVSNNHNNSPVAINTPSVSVNSHMHHQASPQITQRINQLLTSIQSTPTQHTNPAVSTPITQRLRSARNNNLPDI